MKHGDLIEVQIDSLGFEGVSVARHDGKVVFVDGALPGERVIANVRKARRKHTEANLESILEASPHRVKPPCTHFADCGGCSWQQLDYAEQLNWKSRHVADSFERLGKIPYGHIKPILGSPTQWNYRNKMEFSFGTRRWMTVAEINSGNEIERSNFALGLHAPGRYDAILHIDDCMIQHPHGNEILAMIRREAQQRGISAYNTHEHLGFLRNLSVRSTIATNELMIILLTNEPASANEEEFAAWFTSGFAEEAPYVTTLIHAVNGTRSPVAVGEIRTIHGSGYITEELYGVKFRISPFSFFQTNPYQLPNFLDATFAAANIQPTDTVWDLYCGTGSISLPAATKARHVAGVELVESSIADAQANAERNGITNTEFHCTDLHKPAALDFLHTLPAPDVVIVDPPRAGIHEQTLRLIMEIAPPVISYVSCNPATQARDCAILSEYYSVDYLQPLDMFPHSYHIENVARLVRKG
ncbi:MAG: 23S rRNA (uracil(1939)-C(5))-methyltransferase RlmD [Candidatus Kapabacteria bacterium]|nr:23S rRNA (uracil(1939)-C(5))-methyltransferase RlmD [Candidatus Kapabacteria bacterium]